MVSKADEDLLRVGNSLTLEALAEQVMDLARAVGQRLSPSVVDWHLRPYNPDAGLGEYALDGVTNYVTRRLQLSGTWRAAVRAQMRYRQAKRVGRATRNTAEKLSRGVSRTAVFIGMAPQVLLTLFVFLMVILLAYGLWLVGRKIEQNTPFNVVPGSTSTTCGPQISGAGFFGWGEGEDGRGTGFTDFTGVVGGMIADKVDLGEDALISATTWAIDGTAQVSATLYHALGGGDMPEEAVPGQNEPAAYGGGCCPGGSGTGTLPAGYPSTDSPAITAARAAQAAGWSGDELVMAVAVAGAESGWNPQAQNPTSSAKGLWQIMMSYHADKFDGASWTDPTANARVAKEIYDDASGWSPWEVYTTGAYRTYLPRAEQAVQAAGGIAGPYPDLDVPAAIPAAYSPAATPACTDPTVPAGYPTPSGGPVADTVIAWARQQLGDPYVWGAAPWAGPPADDPDVFDCSSLVDSAYLAAGIDLPGRQTTRTLIRLGTPVASQADLRPGDLVFTSSGHVAIALSPTRMIAAPHTGDVVKEQDIYAFYAGRRLVPSGGVPT